MKYALGNMLDGGGVLSTAIRPVGTRAQWGLGAGTLSNGTTDLSETSRITYYANENASNIQVLYSNRVSGVTPSSTNSITIKASVEYGGSLYPLYFSGSRTKTLATLETAFTDKLAGLSIPKGATFYVRTYVSVNAGEKWPRNFRYMASTEGVASNQDYADVLTACPSIAQMFGPLGVFGKKTGLGRGIAILGDSISMGFAVTAEGIGPFVASFDGTALGTTYGKNVPYIHMGKTGERANQYEVLATKGIRDTLINYCTHSAYQYGINDVRNNVSLASMQTTALNNWQYLVDKKIKVWACTLTPNTTSTDSWATTTNQTLANAAQNTVRVAYNDWLRTIPSPLLSGIIETADTCESSRNSGLWKPSHTSDGLHPNSTGFAAYKAVIDPNIFV